MPDGVEIDAGTGEVKETRDGVTTVRQPARPLEQQTGQRAVDERRLAGQVLAAGADGETVTLQQVCAAVAMLLGVPTNRR